ncbi:hypothetical protein HZS_3524, partial [Henneguya salminicola]
NNTYEDIQLWRGQDLVDRKTNISDIKMKPVAQKMYWINGIKVYFPLQPYNSQISIISHVVQALQKSKNCLIESPTGTGKTLALLCAACGWLEDNRNSLIVSKNKNKENISVENENIKSEYFGDEKDFVEFSDKNDFVELSDKNVTIVKNEVIKIPVDEIIETVKDPLLPSRIYYCTRTHRQISQVVSELKRTKYGDGNLRMSILSSRKLSCLNSDVKNAPSLTDACRHITNKSLKFDEKCSYFCNVNLADTHKKLKLKGCPSVWNVEEFVNFCDSSSICPYFSSQKLSENADLIFAPYNYVLNPIISEQMSLNLKNSVIILDEAHNIEDICRSAMSACFCHSSLINCYKELDQISRFINNEEKMEALHLAYFTVSGLISSFSNWILSQESSLVYKSVTVQEKIFSGHECKSSIEEYLKMDPKHFNDIIIHYKKILSSYSKEEYESVPRSSDFSQKIMSEIMLIIEYAIIKSTDNFVVSISKGSQGDLDVHNKDLTLNSEIDTQISTSKIATTKNSEDLNISFICLNPSLAFNYVTSNCRSVILASGTLSPITSFASELGSPFDLAFQTSDHLQPGQAAVFSLGVSTKNTPLRLTYNNIDSLNTQDEVGEIILNICQVTPRGVVCFFPSYTVLEKFLRRWETTTLNGRLSKVKRVYREKKGRTTNEVDEMLDQYFNDVGPTKNLTGAVLFAVCRGRISEGIDFSDDRARTVITIGIPYPNIKMLEIDRKMSFNDIRKKLTKNPSMLAGREWYNIQAFRALNQALGRCIRHRKDWGAIIMIDERFDQSQNSFIPNYYLSNWIRRNLISFNNFELFQESLVKYFKSKEQELITFVPQKTINQSTKMQLKKRKYFTGKNTFKDSRI